MTGDNPAAGAAPAPFHRPGMAYFWVLNDRVDWAEVERQLQAFAAAEDLTALCLHPTSGVPYGGDEWFDFIGRICRRAAELNLRIWLYDEDPFPSGNAGGRITAEHPGLAAQGIRQHVYDPTAQGDTGIFYFPTGPLLWCGLVDEATGAYTDLTARVGLLRRKWTFEERWDSRFFYPDTPLYAAPSAGPVGAEYALTVPEIPPGMRLLALVAGAAEQSSWSPFGPLADSLNPAATRLFLEYTHERYFRALGDLFGATIEAIFTDEPKLFDSHPWTPGLFEDFMRERGYDIRPFLHYLFSDSDCERARLTRLHYREHVARRFRDAWMRPVAAWCRAHGLRFVGHISPEDDPSEQASCLGDLLPLLEEMDLCGTDIIIPAAGDARHPILNVGTVCAVSVAQQRGKGGTMSETGHMMDQLSMEEIARVFRWQTVLGLTAPLGNCAALSVRGPRGGVPPAFSPDHPNWPALADLRRELAGLQAVIRGTRQLAPVALLWPIRSFMMRRMVFPDPWQPLRVDFVALLAACLDRQVGTQIIDEEAVWELAPREGRAALGAARYSHLLIPSCTVLHARTVTALQALQRQGITVIRAGSGPEWIEEPMALPPAGMEWCPRLPMQEAVVTLPRLLDLRDPAEEIRCTAWEAPDGRVARLLMNLRPAPYLARWEGGERLLAPGEAIVL